MTKREPGLVDDIATIIDPTVFSDYYLRHPGPLVEREKLKAAQEALVEKAREKARGILAMIEQGRVES